METTAQVTLDGKLFDERAPIGIKRALKATLQDLAEETETLLFERLRPRPAGVYLSASQAQPGQASTGNYRRNIQTLVRDRFAVVSDGGVVYGSWLEGTSSRNQTTRFKGYKSFRLAAQNVRLKANSIAAKNIRRFVRDMNQ